MDDGLVGLSALEFLDLSYNLISRVENLQFCYCLVHVDLSHNRIKNVQNTVETLGNLRVLNLCDNGLESTIGLEKLLGLEKLDISDNELMQPMDVERLGLLPNLLALELRGNPMTSMAKWRTQVYSYLLKDDLAIDGALPSTSEKQMIETKRTDQPIVPYAGHSTISKVGTIETPKPAFGSPGRALTSEFIDPTMVYNYPALKPDDRKIMAEVAVSAPPLHIRPKITTSSIAGSPSTTASQQSAALAASIAQKRKQKHPKRRGVAEIADPSISSHQHDHVGHADGNDGSAFLSSMDSGYDHLSTSVYGSSESGTRSFGSANQSGFEGALSTGGDEKELGQILQWAEEERWLLNYNAYRKRIEEQDMQKELERQAAEQASGVAPSSAKVSRGLNTSGESTGPLSTSGDTSIVASPGSTQLEVGQLVSSTPTNGPGSGTMRRKFQEVRRQTLMMPSTITADMLAEFESSGNAMEDAEFENFVASTTLKMSSRNGGGTKRQRPTTAVLSPSSYIPQNATITTSPPLSNVDAISDSTIQQTPIEETQREILPSFDHFEEADLASTIADGIDAPPPTFASSAPNTPEKNSLNGTGTGGSSSEEQTPTIGSGESTTKTATEKPSYTQSLEQFSSSSSTTQIQQQQQTQQHQEQQSSRPLRSASSSKFIPPEPTTTTTTLSPITLSSEQVPQAIVDKFVVSPSLVDVVIAKEQQENQFQQISSPSSSTSATPIEIGPGSEKISKSRTSKYQFKPIGNETALSPSSSPQQLDSLDFTELLAKPELNKSGSLAAEISAATTQTLLPPPKPTKVVTLNVHAHPPGGASSSAATSTENLPTDEYLVSTPSETDSSMWEDRIIIVNTKSLEEWDTQGSVVLRLESKELVDVSVESPEPIVVLAYGNTNPRSFSPHATCVYKMESDADVMKLVKLMKGILASSSKKIKCVSCQSIFTMQKLLECPKCTSSTLTIFESGQAVPDMIEKPESLASSSFSSTSSLPHIEDMMDATNIPSNRKIYMRTMHLKDEASGGLEEMLAYFPCWLVLHNTSIQKEQRASLVLSETKLLIMVKRRPRKGSVLAFGKTGKEGVPLASEEDYKDEEVLVSLKLKSLRRIVVGPFWQWFRIESTASSDSYVIVTRSHARTFRFLQMFKKTCEWLEMSNKNKEFLTNVKSAIQFTLKDSRSTSTAALVSEIDGFEVDLYFMAYQRVKAGFNLLNAVRSSVVYGKDTNLIPRSIMLTKHNILICEEDYAKWPSLTLPGWSTPKTAQFNLVQHFSYHEIVSIAIAHPQEHPNYMSVTFEFNTANGSTSQQQITLITQGEGEKAKFVSIVSQRYQDYFHIKLIPETTM
jgi:hypothetical protein